MAARGVIDLYLPQAQVLVVMGRCLDSVAVCAAEVYLSSRTNTEASLLASAPSPPS